MLTDDKFKHMPSKLKISSGNESVTCRQNDRRTDGKTDLRKDQNQYLPLSVKAGNDFYLNYSSFVSMLVAK